MGKGKKKTDIWDLTPEEQTAGLDKFYELEKGNISIMELTNVAKPLNESGLTGDVEALFLEEMGFKKNPSNKTEEDNKEPESIYDLTNNDEIEQADEEDVKNQLEDSMDDDDSIDSDLLKYSDDFTIDFEYDDELMKFVVDDLVAPSVLSIESVVNQNIVGTFDSDDIYEMSEMLIKYIISLKHPTAVFDIDDFFCGNHRFDKVKTFNSEKFVCFMKGSWVLCYNIDTELLHDFKEFVDQNICKHDINGYLKFYVALAYACGSFNEAFFVEDDEYIMKYFKSFHNAQENFIEAFTNDPDTEFIPDDRLLNDDEGLNLLDIQEVQTIVRTTIGSLTGQPYFGDEEDDIDDGFTDDEEDEDESDLNIDNESEAVINAVETVVSEVNKMVTEEIENDLLSPDMEVVETVEKDESLVVDVITKKAKE